MSFKTSIWIGRFDPDAPGVPRDVVPEDSFAAVMGRFADRDAAGELVPPRQPGWCRGGRKRVLGYIGGEYVIYSRAGFAEVVFLGLTERLRGLLAAAARELGCELLHADTWERVADHYLGLTG